MEDKEQNVKSVIKDNNDLDIGDILFSDEISDKYDEIEEFLPEFSKDKISDFYINSEEIHNTKEFIINNGLKIKKRDEELLIEPKPVIQIESFLNKQIIGIGISIIALIGIIIGLTYANFNQKNNNTDNQVVKSGELNITYQSGNTISGEFLPISNDEGMLNTGYSFSVENTGSLAASYQVKIYNNSMGDTSNYLAHNQLYISFDNGIPQLISELEKEDEEIVIENNMVYLILKVGMVDVGETKNHNVKVWLREDAETNIIGKKVNLILEVEAIVGTGEKPLKDLILAQGGGASVIEAKGNPNMSEAPTPQTSGLYSAEDEYGMSYYYRGEKDVLANNVIFAEHQWKIVRINGDGSIRLIYNGECPGNICSINSVGEDTLINGEAYAWNTNKNDNKYAGYMYGGLDGDLSSSLEEAQRNDTNSNAKTVLDNWYEANIKETEYEKYIVDNIFCNDRGITSGDGYGTSATYYKVYTRLYKDYESLVPTLKCEQKNDRFTVSDVSKGNGALTYPIGLITADEGVYGGTVVGFDNESLYLNNEQDYWTLSPNFMGSVLFMSFFAAWSGLDANIVEYNQGLRAVLNVTSEVLVSGGDGSPGNPFVIK